METEKQKQIIATLSQINDHKVEATHTGDGLQPAALVNGQLMERRFNVWSGILLAICTSVTWEIIRATMTPSLLTGGSSSISGALLPRRFRLWPLHCHK